MSEQPLVIAVGSKWRDIAGKVFALTGFDTREDTVTLSREWDWLREKGMEERVLKSLAYLTKYYEEVRE